MWKPRGKSGLRRNGRLGQKRMGVLARWEWKKCLLNSVVWRALVTLAKTGEVARGRQRRGCPETTGIKNANRVGNVPLGFFAHPHSGCLGILKGPWSISEWPKIGFPCPGQMEAWNEGEVQSYGKPPISTHLWALRCTLLHWSEWGELKRKSRKWTTLERAGKTSAINLSGKKPQAHQQG